MVLAAPDSTGSCAIAIQLEPLVFEIIEQIIDALALGISTSQDVLNKTLMACSLNARAFVPRSRHYLFNDLLLTRSGKGLLQSTDLCKGQNSTIPMAGFRNLKLNMAARPKGSTQLLDPSPRNLTTSLANDISGRLEILYLDFPNERNWFDAASFA
ncbi:hypothetical protein WG66_002300 [Moniliophthora roreri]|nr:hypothetical protein WG66_002300 [Moniliophthora roreri]